MRRSWVWSSAFLFLAAGCLSDPAPKAAQVADDTVRFVSELPKVYVSDGTLLDPMSTSDPMLWVDPTTDRVFTNHMWPVLGCAVNIISDDNGESWSQYPLA